MSHPLESIPVAGHEQVSIFRDEPSGLLAIVAIHSTRLGPSLGGCRMSSYDSLAEALEDVLRLSEGMTYKNSLAGLELGGGKSVIVCDRALEEGRDDLFLKFGECVASLNGRYITAEDMGTRVSDIDTIAKVCPYVSGRGEAFGGGGDPSPHTAEGVFQGIRAALGHVHGSESLAGRRVCIQGLGNVGFSLAQKLREAGATLTIAEHRAERLDFVTSELDAQVVDLQAVYDVECDVFAPCAIGAILNKETIPRLNCEIVAGAANNQLELLEDERLLSERGITYVPDFAINSGGVILCAGEMRPDGFDAKWVDAKVAAIYDTVKTILNSSKIQGLETGEVARKLAKERISKASHS
jgi:leucine dehydrogenase